MSGIYVKPTQARATLRCDRCGRRWESSIYALRKWGDEVRACAPAFASGWRVFNGSRSRRTYCPDCGPTVPMHLMHGREPRKES